MRARGAGAGMSNNNELRSVLGDHFPTVVALCGSTRFWREFQAASLRETLAGKIVLSIGAASGTDDEHFGNLPRDDYDRIKAMLDELHLRKIDLADEVLILNCEQYIGESTARELAYAHERGKTIRFLEPLPAERESAPPDPAPPTVEALLEAIADLDLSEQLRLRRLLNEAMEMRAGKAETA